MTAWYRSTLTGERGRLETRNGEPVVILDRPGETVPRRFDPRTWLVEAPRKPFMKAQLGQIAFAADRELARALGQVRDSDRKWGMLTDRQRTAWLHDGPKGRHPRRERLFAVIMDELKDAAE